MPQRAETDRRYEVFGLLVASEIALPELLEAKPGAEADVSIRYGTIPATDERQGLSIHADGALLQIEGVARYWMADGREMVVEPDPAGSERNLRLYLLGSAFAALLHQRTLLPLHANAVVVAGRAIGFMGHPGAGKSTLAAWFHDRGFEVLADDVCLVTGSGSGAPLAHAGIPRLRLWNEALEASGRRAQDYERSFDDMEKYTVPTHSALTRRTVPLSHLYVLEKAADGDAGEVARLRGSDAVEALVANTYRGAYVPLMGRTREHLMACAALAAAVPVFRAPRRWSLASFDEEARALEAHARRLIAAAEGG